MVSLLHSSSRFYFTKNGKKTKSSSSKIFARFRSEEDDTIFKTAISAASIRFQESLRPDPLFVDPYAGCFLSSVSSEKDMSEWYPMTTAASSPCYYSLATKFLDDDLLSLVSSSDELSLSWPRSSVIYDISFERVFKEAFQLLEGVGAKISKGCVLLHVPLESSDVHATLCKKGFSGNRSSLWVLQGLPLMTLTGFEDILSTIGRLAVEGCIFMGELPGLLLEAELGNMGTKQDIMEKLFMSHGFQVDVIEYAEIARKFHLDPPQGDYEGVHFYSKIIPVV